VSGTGIASPRRAPIALFVYARPDHVRRTIEALRRNPEASESDLVVFSDGARTPDKQMAVDSVREYLDSVSGFRSITVHRRATNHGLARSIIDGVASVLGTHDSVIVLEDDMVTAPNFLRYMNDALERFSRDDRIISVHGYMYPLKHSLPEAFFLPGADCWGWGTWRRGWALFNPDGRELLEQLKKRDLLGFFDLNGAYPYSRMLADQIAGRNDSWAVRWHASAILAGKLTLFPGRSLVHNIGNDSSGTHRGDDDVFDVDLSDAPIDLSSVDVAPCEECRRAIEVFLREAQSSKLRFILSRVKGVVSGLVRNRRRSP
jgi:hypothetical protein